MKFLFVSPVGQTTSELLPAVLNRMLEAGAEVLLAVYDDWEPIIPKVHAARVRVVREPGRQKWQIALAHLDPETVAAYDFIFLWDDDIGISDFDPLRFLRIMEENGLECAQPSLRSPHRLSHAITAQRLVGRRFEHGKHEVGRFTNFVEIMVPVFSRQGWRRIYGYLDDENTDGCGYDFIPMGLRGIVDCMHVVHTREVRDKEEESILERDRFMDRHGLKMHQMVDMGCLVYKDL